MANKIYKCKVCGGDLGWDPAAQTWKCKFCDSIFSLEDFEESGKTEIDENYEKGKNATEFGYQESMDDTNINPEDLRVYKCSFCGSEIVTDKTTMATTCVFCNNPVVLQEQVDTEFKPEYVIPFKIEKDKVEDIYLKYIKKPFVPDEFLSKKYIEKIKGVYIPFWLYDIDVDGNMTAEGDKMRRYSISQYHCVEHKIYNVERAGDIKLSKIPVDASSKTPNDAMDSIEPFNYDELVKFEMPYLAGFLAERYDQTKTECSERATVRAENTMKDQLRSTITGYDNIKSTAFDANTKIKKSVYAMLPTYILSTEYNNEKLLFAINGQTGKTCGNVPIDKKKLSKFRWKTFGLSFIGLNILMFLAFLIY